MATGEYTIPNIPVGTYTSTASMPGYITQTLTTIISEGLTTTVDFQLSEKEPTEPTISYIPLLFIAAACIIMVVTIVMYRK